MAVESGAVIGFFDEVVGVDGGGRGDRLVLAGDAGFQGVEVGFHEPWKRFEIDELDGGCQGWIGKERMDAAAFLAVAGEGAFCV